MRPSSGFWVSLSLPLVVAHQHMETSRLSIADMSDMQQIAGLGMVHGHDVDVAELAERSRRWHTQP